MFLASFFVQGLIVLGAILLFFGSVILNKRTKAPDGVEVDIKCHSCISTSCIVKTTDFDKIREEIKCEETNEAK